MQNIKYIKVKPIGSFSRIQDRQEFKVIEHRDNDIVCKAKGKRTNYIIGFEHIFEFSKSQYSKEGNFLGNITQVEGGYIPEGSIINYFGNKVYKSENDALKYLINKAFEKKRKAIFGYLARNEFYYSNNKFVKRNRILDLVKLLKIQFDLSILTNSQIERIVKKYFKAEVIDYVGQGGYKTKAQIFHSHF